MAAGAGKLLLQGISALVLVALVFVGVSLLFDVVRAVVSALVFAVVGYVAWRIIRALNR